MPRHHKVECDFVDSVKCFCPRSHYDTARFNWIVASIMKLDNHSQGYYNMCVYIFIYTYKDRYISPLLVRFELKMSLVAALGNLISICGFTSPKHFIHFVDI